MPEEEEYLKLPVETRWTHANWKARKSAYDEVAEGIAKGRGEAPAPDELRLACSDTNVIALESGIKLLTAHLDTLELEDARSAAVLREQVAKPLTEKGLPALKPAVKTAAKEALLKLVGVADPNGVVGDVLLSLSAKSPKLVVGAAQMLTAIFTEFGAPVADCKPVLQSLPALFGHADPKIRTAAAELACALGRWIGEAPTLAVLREIKPLQLKDLQERFAKAPPNPEVPRQTLQQAANAANAANAASANDGAGDSGTNDVDMDAAPGESDGWEYLPPVDVVSKIKDSFWTDVQSAKWKERLEALTNVTGMLEKAGRLDPKSDYGNLVAELLRVIAKDANQMCATQATAAVTAITLGLRDAFARQASQVIEAVVERFKEKRPAAIEAVTNCLDATFAKALGGDPQPVLEQVWPVASLHKLPTVRLESTKYLMHLLTECRTAPKLATLEEAATGAVKFLSDPQEPMRAAGAALIAVTVKIAGEKRLAPVLRGLDEHKKKRVDTAIAAATANCQLTAAPAAEKPKPAPANRVGRGGRPIPTRRANPSSTQPTPSTQSARPAQATQSTQPTQSAQSARPTQSTQSTQSSIQPNTSSNTQTNQARPLRPNLHSAPRPAGPVRPNLGNAASPIGRRGMPALVENTSLSLTSPSQMAAPRESRPSISSTPKVAKRTVQRAEFTPARDYEAHRRRIASPARMHTDDEFADDEPDIGGGDSNEHAMHEIARLTAQLNLEKSLRAELEKRLALTQVEKDQEIVQLREDNATLRVQLHAQREELRVFIQSERQRQAASALSSEDVSTRLSVLNIDTELPSSRPPSIARPDSASPSHRVRAAQGRSGVLPIAPSTFTQPSTGVEANGLTTDSQSWERAVSMTHNLKQRIEQLKQMKERTF